MDLSSSNLLSGLFISSAGMGFFIYGKKTQRLYPLLAGILMCIYPFFVEGVGLLWLITAILLAALFFLRGR